MKYVMLKVGNSAYPILFPSHFVHEDVAVAMTGVLKEMRPGKEVEVVGAGDVTVYDAEVGGSSSTLKMDSRGRPDKLLIVSGEYTAYWED